MYHHGTLVGMLASVFLIPKSCTAIIAVSNAHPLADTTDWTGQLVLETIPGEDGSHDFVQLAEETRKGQLAAYANLTQTIQASMEAPKVVRPLNEYCGKYYNEGKNFYLEVREHGCGLVLNVQGLKTVAYSLHVSGKDSFYWLVNREEEQCNQCMFAWTYPGIHQLSFQRSEQNAVEALIWHHDPSDSSLETFTRSRESVLQPPLTRSD